MSGLSLAGFATELHWLSATLSSKPTSAITVSIGALTSAHHLALSAAVP